MTKCELTMLSSRNSPKPLSIADEMKKSGIAGRFQAGTAEEEYSIIDWLRTKNNAAKTAKNDKVRELINNWEKDRRMKIPANTTSRDIQECLIFAKRYNPRMGCPASVATDKRPAAIKTAEINLRK